jgi:Right handed beta helix region
MPEEGSVVRSTFAAIGLGALLASFGPGVGRSADGNQELASPGLAETAISRHCILKRQEMLRTATRLAPEVEVDCSLTLSGGDVVTKRILINGSAASGITIDCNGAVIDGRPMQEVNRGAIEIRSLRDDRLEGVTVRGCAIIGSVFVGGAKSVSTSSRSLGHVERMRESAATRITLDNVKITGVGPTPLYIEVGVTDLVLSNSEITGVSDDVAIYLDAESSRNIIRNNKIYPATTRELIAVDSSSYNVIINNKFRSLNHGGIFLYRNCGENGTIRHTTPRNNTIVNNVFYYLNYDGPMPAVWIGSRNGYHWRPVRISDRWVLAQGTPISYCDEDQKPFRLPFGSSASNLDWARNNVVMQNQIYLRKFSEMIREGGSFDSPNAIAHNTTVTPATVLSRRAGCYVKDGYRKNFIVHGEVLKLFRSGSNGGPACRSYEVVCQDGTAIDRPSTCRPIVEVALNCQIEGNNSGCSRTASCPSGMSIIGGSAACNLESGTISARAANDVAVNTISVVRPSDAVSAGSCFVGDNRVASGARAITGTFGRQEVRFGCAESDTNGGDCHIRGVLYCQ